MRRHQKRSHSRPRRLGCLEHRSVVDALSFPNAGASERRGGGGRKRETENRMRAKPHRCSLDRAFDLFHRRASGPRLSTREAFQLWAQGDARADGRLRNNGALVIKIKRAGRNCQAVMRRRNNERRKSREIVACYEIYIGWSLYIDVSLSLLCRTTECEINERDGSPASSHSCGNI